MWIEETQSGKFKFTEQYTDYMTGKKKRVSVTLPKNTAAAKKKRRFDFGKNDRGKAVCSKAKHRYYLGRID
ncbi:MAG TPA: hypothetical protein H9858_00880 [Candidatus Blautia stercoravium]|nr:hypothetical protein [Candidatus Blautia stercoravium]